MYPNLSSIQKIDLKYFPVKKATRLPSPESESYKKKKKDIANALAGDSKSKRNGSVEHEPTTPGDKNTEGKLSHLQQIPHTSSPATPDTTVPPTPAGPGLKRLNVLAMQTDVMASLTNAFLREGSAVGIHSATPCPSCAHTLLDEEVIDCYDAVIVITKCNVVHTTACLLNASLMFSFSDLHQQR